MIVKKNLPKILICDDDRNIHSAIKSALANEYEFKSAYHGDEALAVLKNQTIDLVLMDMQMRTDQEGLETIPKVLEIQPEIIIVFFSGRTDFNSVRSAMKGGAYDYVPKDAGPDELRHTFSKALEYKKLKSQKKQATHEIKASFKNKVLIGASTGIEKVRKQIERAKLSSAPLIIFGETGTGKEVVARLLRKSNLDGTLEPFVAIDSGTFQSSVSESVLFGYEKGAFTGADKTTRGLFEEANEGVIYFDELANMPLEIQNKLLRVIQEKEILRIGATRPISLDFRIICATNQDLEKMIAQGRFKDDLFQRMNVLQIQIPPLRERSEDIPLLLEHYANSMANGLPVIRFLPETVAILQNYSFPGNVRELMNLVQYLYAMSDETEISPLDLPAKFQNRTPYDPTEQTQDNLAIEKNFYKRVGEFEKTFLALEYKRLEGNISKLSLELGMDRSYLHSKLKNYGIHSIRKKETLDN